MRQQASVRYALDMLDFKAIVKFANRNRFGSRKRNPLYGSKVLETNDLKLDVSDSSTDEFHIKLPNKYRSHERRSSFHRNAKWNPTGYFNVTIWFILQEMFNSFFFRGEKNMHQTAKTKKKYIKKKKSTKKMGETENY